jgi:glycerophosphoryl diester phosphodiesterase
MKIFAHRGMSFEFPENTLVSYEKSLEEGFGLEIDVHRSKDGNLVIIHDLNVKRLTGIDKPVTEMTLDEIRASNYSGHFDKNYDDEKMPTFEEVINLVKHKGHKDAMIAVHVKNENEENVLELLANEFKKHDLHSKWFLFDLTIEGATRLKKLDPKIMIAVSVGEKKYAKTIYLLDEIIDMDCFDYVWADEWIYGLYSKEYFDKIKSSGKKSYVISPELHKDHGHPLSLKGYEKCWEMLIAWKVDGVCTDYPKEFREMIEKIKS